MQIRDIDVKAKLTSTQGSFIYSVPGQVICFEKRREYFLATQSCCARKPCPNIPIRALARLRKSTGLSVRLAPVGSTPASLPARLSKQITCPFTQSLTCLDDVVLDFHRSRTVSIPRSRPQNHQLTWSTV